MTEVVNCGVGIRDGKARLDLRALLTGDDSGLEGGDVHPDTGLLQGLDWLGELTVLELVGADHEYAHDSLPFGD
jgi:hypothetical protein